MSAQVERPFLERPRLTYGETIAEHAATVVTEVSRETRIRAQIEADCKREESWAKTALISARIRAALAEKAPVVKPNWDAVSEFNYHQDSGCIDGAEVGNELSDADRRFAFSAEGRFLAMARERTGEFVSPDKIREWREASAKLLEQSFRIADKMTLAGWDAYRKTPFGIFRYFVHSRHLERIPSFRRCCFIPSVAQAERAPMIAALTSFLERHPYARMWTMTSGPRVGLLSVRSTLDAMHRKTSELNAQPFMREAGLEIVFRSSELGTPESDATGERSGGEIERDENGQLLFHAHEHLVVVPTKGFIPPAKWSALLDKVGAFWGSWWTDGGETPDGRRTSGLIVQPREVCKYVTKPGEMEKLTGAELVALQDQLSRLKLVHPMGSFAAELKEISAARERLVREQTPDGPVFQRVKNWNVHARRTRSEAAQDAAQKLDKRGSTTELLRVVSRQMPGFGPCGVSEPRVVVMCSRWDEEAVRRDPLVARLIEHTAAKFRKGEAIRVHVCTPVVGETRDLGFVRTLAPPRMLPTGAELAGFAR